jgi:hypothetical protein
MILHAGMVAALDGGRWRGVLIQGPSGCGKSDLALRMLDLGFRLVADDRTLVWACEGRLFGRAPAALAGLIEVRGLDVVAAPALAFCEVALAVRCGPAERVPEPQWAEFAGLRVPALSLPPLEASAPAKLRRALLHLGQAAEGAYLTGRAARSLPRPGGESR